VVFTIEAVNLQNLNLRQSHSSRTFHLYRLSLHRALWKLYIVHSPTNELLLNLEKFKIYIKIHINIAPLWVGL